jgi:hypothetical protein
VGFREQEVLDMPLDKFMVYTLAAGRRQMQARIATVSDTASAVAGLLSKEGISGYLNILKESIPRG